MKKLSVVAIGIAALGFTSSAFAADMAARPYKAPPPVIAPIYNWSGFYIGVNGGWGNSHNCWDFVGVGGVVVADACRDASGGVVGGQIGYRWQVNQFVFGLEAQGDWADLNASRVSLIAPAFSTRTRVDGIGLFTGQIGYAWNSFLLYVKCGAAVVNDKYDTYVFAAQPGVPAGQIFTRGSETRWGGVVGVGGEYAFTRNWSFALEYDHLFMGDSTVRMTADPFFIAQLSHNTNIRQDVDMVTARINYRFGGPVVAKY